MAAQHWYLIQNLAPSTMVWRQCDIRISNDEPSHISRGPVSLTQNYPGRSIASKRQAREASFRLPLLPLTVLSR